MLNGSTVQLTGGTGAGQHAVIYDYTGATDTATVHTQYTSNQWLTNPSTDTTYEVIPGTVNVQVWNNSGVTTNVQTKEEMADQVWDELQSEHTTAGSMGVMASELASVLVDTAEIGAAGAGLTAVPYNSAWDVEIQSEAADALTAYDPPTNAELSTATANVSVDEIQATAVADLFNTDSGTTYSAAVAGSVVKETADNAGSSDGSGLTAIPWNSAWDAEVQSEATDALNAYDPPTDTEMDSGFAALPTAAENAAQMLSEQRILTGTCDSGSTTTCVDDALTQAAETQIDDRLICFDDSWCALITGFTPASDQVTTTKVAPSTRASKAYTIFPATLN